MSLPITSSDLLAAEKHQAMNNYRSALSVVFNGRSESKHIHSYYDFYINHPSNMEKDLEEELARAAKIQDMLFPAVLPNLARCELAARNRPAFLFGGDYYDVLPTADHGAPYLLCVADVSGKGLPASLLMSNLQATLRTAIGYRPPLMNLVSNANKLLYATTPEDKFITAIFVNCEPNSGVCKYVNAGHNGGVLIRSEGTIEAMKTTGPPLGMLENMPFLMESLELRAGDVLCLYSDGVPEAFNVDEEEWGDVRFMNCLCESRHLSSLEIISKVFEELDSFAEDMPQHDDITMLVLKRKG